MFDWLFGKKPQAQPQQTAAEWVWAHATANSDGDAGDEGDDRDDWWDGYAAPALPAGVTEADLFSYELSAYSDTVGYDADGIQRVSPLRKGGK